VRENGPRLFHNGGLVLRLKIGRVGSLFVESSGDAPPGRELKFANPSGGF